MKVVCCGWSFAGLGNQNQYCKLINSCQQHVPNGCCQVIPIWTLGFVYSYLVTVLKSGESFDVFIQCYILQCSSISCAPISVIKNKFALMRIRPVVNHNTYYLLNNKLKTRLFFLIEFGGWHLYLLYIQRVAFYQKLLYLWSKNVSRLKNSRNY